MTGRILVDDTAPIAALEYSSDRNDPAWDRFGLDFVEGGSLVIRDPRRLGGVELDPDESRLGPDAAAITLKPFRAILTASSAPLKARLMDQAKIAGIGNLLADDMLYRSGLAPSRPANSLSDHEQAKLHRSMRRTIEVLGARGGSHTGDLQVERKRGGVCPRCPRSSCVATMWGSHHLLVRRLSDLNPAQPATVMMRVVVDTALLDGHAIGALRSPGDVWPPPCSFVARLRRSSL